MANFSLFLPLSFFMIARLLCDHAKTNDSRRRVSRIRDGREPATLIKDARLSERGKGLESTPRAIEVEGLPEWHVVSFPCDRGPSGKIVVMSGVVK